MTKRIDAALNGGGTYYPDNVFFFKGAQYIKYDWDEDELDEGYPAALSVWGLPAPFDQGLDAAINGAGPAKGKAWLFKGSQYLQMDWGNTLADLAANTLPVPSPTGDLLHFGRQHPQGVIYQAAPKAYSVSWKLANGTIIDDTNSASSNRANALIPGEKGALVLSKTTGSFAVGDVFILFVYYYRPTHEGMDLDAFLTFDPALLAPPTNGTVTVTKLIGKNPNPSANTGSKADALRIEFLSPVNSVDLGFTVSTKAHATFQKWYPGPDQTYGLFPVGLYPPGTTPNTNQTGELYFYTRGAWLR